MIRVLPSRASAVFAILASVAALAPDRSAADAAAAVFVDRDGHDVGRANIAPLAAGGVHLTASFSRLLPGIHAFHIHETGICDTEGAFKSANGHFNPSDAQHGREVAEGAHAGDMANLHVPMSGRLITEAFLDSVSLEGNDPATLFDEDGSAIVVHQGADDYRSQPSGAAGERIACAVVPEPQTD